MGQWERGGIWSEMREVECVCEVSDLHLVRFGFGGNCSFVEWKMDNERQPSWEYKFSDSL